MSKTETISHVRPHDSPKDPREKERQRELEFIAAYGDDPHSKESSSRMGKASTELGLADFEQLKTLGTGTFARVWLSRLRGSRDGHGGRNGAVAKARDQVFALKILRKVDIIKLKQVEHVRNERQTLGTVSGLPFVTSLITTFADNNSLYMLVSSWLPEGNAQ